MSQLAQHEIETIVRMVVDRLRDSSGATAAAVTSSAETAFNRGPNGPRSLSNLAEVVTTQSAATGQFEPGVLVIPTPLITLDDLVGKLSGIHTLRVSARSLLTPAVRDELRRANIKVSRGEIAFPSMTNSSVSRRSGSYNIVAGEAKLQIVKSIAKQFTVNALTTSLTMLDIVEKLTRLDDFQRAIWCSARPYAALLACSQASAQMRVACLHQAADLSQAVLEIQPNILVLDDARWSGYQVGRLVQAWSRFEKQAGSK